MSQPGRDANDPGSGDANKHKGGLRRCIRPEAPTPVTVLVAVTGDGGLVLQGWRDGPNAYVCAQDAGSLRHALDTAFRTDAPVAWCGGSVL